MTARNWRKVGDDRRMRDRGTELLGGSRSGAPKPSTPQAPRRHTALPAPVTIAEFWANRGGESLRVQLRSYEGRALIDVRKFYSASDGTLQPSPKGFALDVRKLPLLARAVAKALNRAIELGLIDAGRGDG